jgi:hypothetical protein
LPYIPIVNPEGDYQQTGLIEAPNDGWRVDFAGSVTEARFAMRLLGNRTDEKKDEFARRLGANPSAVDWEIKTLSKNPVSGSAKRIARLARSLPMRMTRRAA